MCDYFYNPALGRKTQKGSQKGHVGRREKSKRGLKTENGLKAYSTR